MSKDLSLIAIFYHWNSDSCYYGENVLPSWAFGLEKSSTEWDMDLLQQGRWRFSNGWTSKGQPAVNRTSTDDDSLILQGLAIGNIDWCSSKSTAERGSSEIPKWHRQAAQHFKVNNKWVEDTFDSKFLRTLTHGRRLHASAQWKTYLRTGQVGPEVRQLALKSRLRLIWVCVLGIGIAPGAARTGDMVVVLFGGPFPFLLRPYEDHYHVIGPCWMEGLAKGEVINAWKVKSNWRVKFKMVPAKEEANSGMVHFEVDPGKNKFYNINEESVNNSLLLKANFSGFPIG